MQKTLRKVTGNKTTRTGTTWDVDFKSTITYDKTSYDNVGDAYPWWVAEGATYPITSQFVSAAEVPDGSDGNGAYKFGWEDSIPQLNYPAFMVGFEDVTKADIAGYDELQFSIYLSDTMNKNYTLWVTSALQTNVWDTQKKFMGGLIPTGTWTTISMPISKFTNQDGLLAPIAFIFEYAPYMSTVNTDERKYDTDRNNDGLDPATIYFDNVVAKTVVKTLATDYMTQDLSEVVPITQKTTFTGSYTGDPTQNFDFTKDQNIQFIRTDGLTHVVKMKMSISNIDKNFETYFVMNGSDKYFQKGGIFYWISNEGCNIGHAGETFEITSLPASVRSGVEFELELRAIPYYVEGSIAGYYATILINGEEACQGNYISKGDCTFGSYFGYYMHNTNSEVSVTLAPLNAAATSPMKIEVKPSPYKTQLGLNKMCTLKTTVTCNLIGAQDPVIEIVDGAQYATLSGSRLKGVADGIVTIRAKVTNQFGTFYGEEFKMAIGSAQLPTDSSDSAPSGDNSSSGTTQSNSSAKVGGCGSSVSVGAVAALSVALVTCFVINKRKEN